MPELSSCSPPATLARAVDWLPETALEMNAAVPAVVSRSRPVVANEWSFTTVTATEMPTPVLDDLVSPIALVATLFASDEVALKLPPIVSRPPLPRLAWVSSAAIEIATTGVTAVLPLPPLVASVSI